MRIKIILTFLILSTFITGYCTVWTVNSSGYTFTPATITIIVGDTVNFSIASSHNSVEVSQTTWNSNGSTALSGGFQTPMGGGIVLPAQLTVGTHYYVCVPHASMGMKGTIIVQNCIAPTTPGTISGNTNPCSLGTYTYSVANVSGATSYTWTLPGSWTGTSTTNSITTVAGSSNGNITVMANNNCGSSANQTMAVSINTAPATPGTITGNASICSSSSNTYSVVSVNGATTYTWTLPTGWSGSSAINSITTLASTTSGNITVKANNTCGSSAVKSVAVTVSTPPATPGTINGIAGICKNTTNTYNVSNVSGATSYTWSLPTGWLGTSTTNSIITSSNSTSGNIVVVANNSCGSSAMQTLAVVVNVADTTVSQTGTTLTANATGATYQWINCNGNTIISGQTSQSFTANTNGSYAVIITKNSCSDTSSCHTVGSVGIIENQSLSNINIYPNPSNGIFNFNNLNNSLVNNIKIEVYNIQGERVYQSEKIISKIDLSNQSKGMYFMKIIEGNSIITKKILIQ